jgi:tetratricopeptide (TPR) repeat protein
MRRNLLICLLLAGITLAIYWPARHYGIIYYDDPLFTTENAMVKSGLNWHSLWWAFSSVVVANWHPVTSLSFVLDNQWFGANPGAEHVVNVAFHTASAVLLFLVLQRITGCPWRSAVVAAIFAWHPLRVESVAWISERKDVLSVFFFLLTLLFYNRFAQATSLRTVTLDAKSGDKGSGVWHLGSGDYWLALVFFALGLMSKPMLVTLPFVLLLLDFWPLKRVTSGEWRVTGGTKGKHSTLNPEKGRGRVAQLYAALRLQLLTLLLEKWPFFLLSAGFSGLTYALQKTHAAVVQLSRLSLEGRLGNAVTSYQQYLAKLFWPTKLAVIYPYPKSQDDLEIWLTALLLLAISAWCVCQLFRRPYLAVGWFWFLGTAVPIIGLVQVGEQAMADRYTYIPLIGPVISLVWLAADWCQTNTSRKFILAPATVILLAVCAILGRRQVQFWKNTVPLFEHTIAVTTDNPSAQFCLGVGLEQEGRLNKAMMHYRIQAALMPQDYRVHYSLARVLAKQGQWQEAIREYDNAAAMGGNPDDYVAHLNLADALTHLGREPEAVFHLNEALRINPDSTEAMNNLAWLLATSPDPNIRDGQRAIELAGRAGALTNFKQTIFVGTLAAAYAEAGRFDDAMATAEKACALAEKSGEPDLLKRNQDLLELYRRHQPYREDAEKPVPTGP